MSDKLSPQSSPGLASDASKHGNQRRAAFQWLKRFGVVRAPAAQEDRFPVRDTDWLELRGKIANLKKPAPYLAGVGWTCVGISVVTLSALLVWLPADSDLPVKAHTQYVFVTPLLIIAAVAGVVISVFSFVVGHQTRQLRLTTVEDVLTDMDALYEPYSHTMPGRPRIL
jgi:hypothetical protein